MNRSSSMFRMLMGLTLLGIGFDGSNNKQIIELTPEEREELKQISAQKRMEQLKKQGVKQWTIDGVTVVARDRRNAERKVNNILKQIKSI